MTSFLTSILPVTTSEIMVVRYSDNFVIDSSLLLMCLAISATFLFKYSAISFCSDLGGSGALKLKNISGYNRSRELHIPLECRVISATEFGVL